MKTKPVKAKEARLSIAPLLPLSGIGSTFFLKASFPLIKFPGGKYRITTTSLLSFLILFAAPISLVFFHTT